MVGPAFGARPARGGEQQDVPKPVKRLWSEYPLNSSKPQSDQPGTRLEPSPLPETRAREGGEPGGGISSEVLLAATAAGLGGLALVVLALGRGAVATVAGTTRRGLRSRLAVPALALQHGSTRGDVPNHSPNDGGHRMSNFRRTRKSKDENESTARSADGEQKATEKFAAYSASPAAEADAGANQQEAETTLPSGVQEDPDPRGEDAAAYEQVGEQVTEVLTSAHQAANRLRASATEEVERVRRQAEEYATETRAAADSYADERRKAAETEAGQIKSDAEQQANAVRAAAQKDAVEAQRDAVERRQALLEETERSEERLQNLLQVFRAMTQRLETLVGHDAQGEADDRGDSEPEETDKDLADALELRRSSDSESRSSAAR